MNAEVRGPTKKPKAVRKHMLGFVHQFLLFFAPKPLFLIPPFTRGVLAIIERVKALAIINPHLPPRKKVK